MLLGGLTSTNNLKINPIASLQFFLLQILLHFLRLLSNLFIWQASFSLTSKLILHDHRDRKNKVANLKCRVCAQGFELSPINYLMQPIDVFCAWVDELEESRRGGAGINADTSEDEDDDLFGTHGSVDIIG